KGGWWLTAPRCWCVAPLSWESRHLVRGGIRVTEPVQTLQESGGLGVFSSLCEGMRRSATPVRCFCPGSRPILRLALSPEFFEVHHDEVRRALRQVGQATTKGGNSRVSGI